MYTTILPVMQHLCFCGNVLRSEQERTRHWCIECRMRPSLCYMRLLHLSAWIRDDEATRRWIVISAAEAIIAERTALSLTGWLDEPNLRNDILLATNEQISIALKAWVQTALHVWQCLQGVDAMQQKDVVELHTWCVNQIQHLLTVLTYLPQPAIRGCQVAETPGRN